MACATTIPRMDVSLEALLQIVERTRTGALEEESQQLKAVVESYAYLTGLLNEQRITLRRLRQMLFGSNNEKLRNIVKSGSESDSESESESKPESEPEPPGPNAEAGPEPERPDPNAAPEAETSTDGDGSARTDPGPPLRMRSPPRQREEHRRAGRKKSPRSPRSRVTGGLEPRSIRGAAGCSCLMKR